MSYRRRIVIAAAASLLWIAAITGIAALNVASSRSVATVGGCPSNAFPIRPGSALDQYSAITVGGTTGCWTTYHEPKSASEQEVFGYYMDPSNTRGWTVLEAYDSTHFAAFRNSNDPQIQAEVDVTTFQTFFVAGPSTVTLAISVCRCDPRTMAQ
jgi:hypothetical protein